MDVMRALAVMVDLAMVVAMILAQVLALAQAGSTVVGVEVMVVEPALLVGIILMQGRHFSFSTVLDATQVSSEADSFNGIEILPA